MNIRTRAEEKCWAAMCKAGQHDFKFIGEFVCDPIADCSSISKAKIYQCIKCKAYIKQQYLNPYRAVKTIEAKSKETDGRGGMID